MKSIRILLMIVDPVVLGKFRALLRLLKEVEIVGDPATIDEGLQQVEQLRPDLILLDHDLVKVSAVDLIRQFVKIPGPSRVLVLCEHIDPLFLRDIALSGASWAIDKKATLENVLSIIQQKAGVDSQEKNLYDMVKYGFWSGQIDPNVNLTPREREVLKLVAKGKPDRQIAMLLGISEESVRNYGYTIICKLMPKNRPEMKHSIN